MSGRAARSFGAVFAIALFAATIGMASAFSAPIADAHGTDAAAATLPPVVVSHFYEVPNPLRFGAPGDVIKREHLDVPGLNGTAWRVMYHSRSVQGQDIAVTGFVMVPPTRPPKEGYPVISWAHGTTGIADMCAPSMHLDNPSDMAQLGDSLLLSDANQILADGYLLERTDYEGLGTPGRHAYLVGESEARGVIDIVRAARNLPQLHASNRYVVAGHSEGGEGTLFAMHIADQYAPELHLLGVVAESPPSQLELIAAVLGPQGNYVLLSTAAGFNAAYGDALAPLDQVLTPLGEQFLADVDRVCANALHDETASLDPSTLISTNPSTVPTWDALLQANDAGTFTTPSPEPLLTIHSISDQTVPFVASQLLFGQLCAIGQDETLWLYPGISHFHTPDVSMTDALTWIGHRFDGQPTPDLMTPTAVPGIQTAHCP